MPQTLRITIVISYLWGGGAERVVSILANSWAEKGHDVSILSFQPEGATTYPLDSSLKVIYLNLMGESRNLLQGFLPNLRRIQILRQAIRQSRPDVVVSFLTQANILTVLATRGLRKPVIISERTSPRRRALPWIWNTLRALIYPFADAIVWQTKAAVAESKALSKRTRVVAIPNPIAVPASVARAEEQTAPGSKHILIAMGRLIPEKGFDLLLQAFARLADRHRDWLLTIIGKGPLQSQLQDQRDALKLTGRVCFAGELADPFPELCAADLFVLPSRFEGFPNALIEAMACGLPAVSFDCPDGPREIIRPEVDGVLVPAEDIDALAAALDRLMANPEKRKRLAARAPEVLNRFSREQVVSLWQQLFDELLRT